MSGGNASPADSSADVSVESLRRLGLGALGAWSDPNAYQALSQAEIEIEPDVAVWESSEGRVHGQRVTLHLDPERFAQVSRAPAVIDALCSAVAKAVGNTPGQALADFVVRSASAALTRRAPYRDR